MIPLRDNVPTRTFPVITVGIILALGALALAVSGKLNAVTSVLGG